MFMPKSLLLMISFGVILSDVYIQPTQGLKCYECIDCTKPVIEKTCDEDEKKCVTTIMEDGIVNRQCIREEVENGWIGSGITCDTYGEPTQGNGNKFKACFCNTDMCNTHTDSHASIVTLSKAQILCSILASFFAYRFVPFQ